MSAAKRGAKQTIVSLKASDGFVVNSLLVTKESKKKEEILRVPILLQIHGLLGHFLARGTPRLLPRALLERGFGSLSINTRLAFAGQVNGEGIFNDTMYDIDAAVTFLEDEGFKNIFILGYSLGASMLVYWASQRERTSVKGLILEGPLYSMPDSQKRKFAKWGSSPTYDEIYERAKIVLGDEPYKSRNDETFVVYRSRGPNRTPASSEVFTYKTWWFMTGPEAYGTMTYRHIGGVKLPILIIRGEGDWITEEWEAEALGRLARKAGNKAVRVRKIPEARHDCMENPEEMLKAIVDMLITYSGL
jgi:pimeloyl-ACP methyl ester carboxylesterase